MNISSVDVSIICNTYNHEKYISKAIDGFLMQDTDLRIEVLIHDDASSDHTPEIIQKYASQYPDIIKPILQRENTYSKGINCNLVYQYPRARGKYVAFCEGDDFWIDSHKLAVQYAWLEEHPEDIGCVHRYVVVDENNDIQDIRTFGYYEKEERYGLKDFEEKELPSQLASLMCRNIFTDIEKGYPKEFIDVNIQGDIKLYLYLLNYGSVYRLPQVLSAYRFICYKGGNSWSSRMLSVAKGFKDWIALGCLEEKYYRIYNRKISLDIRKKAAAAATIKDFYRFPTSDNFKNMCIALWRQKGILKYLFDRVSTKLK